jgi:hypothetical protein
MKICRHVTNVVSLLSLSSIWACSSAGQQDDGAYAENGPPNEVVFEAKWSDTGRFQIVRDASGHLGMAVTGVIGKDDPSAASKLVRSSWVDTYRALLPNQSVPRGLAALEAKRARVVAQTDRAPLAKVEPTEAAFAPDQSSFLNATCKDFWLMACSVHVDVDCNHSDSTNFIETTANVCPSNSDVSFFWNAVNDTGSHALSGVSGSGYGVSAYTWGWHSWWTGYSCAKAHMWNSVSGELGVTNHYRQPMPCARTESPE